MQPINKKPKETPVNNFYGVDVNNKEAVEKEFARLQNQHRIVTFLVIIMLIVVAFLVFDFVRVNQFEGKPILAIEEKIDGGTKFKGIGYEVLYCDNGERHVGVTLYKKCQQGEATTVSNFVYKRFVDYVTKQKMLNKDNLDTLEFISVDFDEKNEKDGSDYHINLKYTCKKDGCLKFDKEFYSNDNIHLYLRLDKYNDVYEIAYFKTSGLYYDSLVQVYTENLKTHLIEKQLLNVDNLRIISLKLVENHGMYKFRGTSYDDSYLVQVNYLCVDNTNSCVTAFENEDREGDYSNLMFYASMFVDREGKVLLFGPKEYFDL